MIDQETMDRVAKRVASVLPEGATYFVLAFTDPRQAMFVSNGNRDRAVAALRQTADKLQLRQDRPHSEERAL